MIFWRESRLPISESACNDVNYMPFLYYCNTDLYCLSRRNSNVGSASGLLVEYFLLRCILRDVRLSLSEMFLMLTRIIGNHLPKETPSHCRRHESSKRKSLIKIRQQARSETNGTKWRLWSFKDWIQLEFYLKIQLVPRLKHTPTQAQILFP
jgi:hypothetical protein